MSCACVCPASRCQLKTQRTSLCVVPVSPCPPAFPLLCLAPPRWQKRSDLAGCVLASLRLQHNCSPNQVSHARRQRPEFPATPDLPLCLFRGIPFHLLRGKF